MEKKPDSAQDDKVTQTTDQQDLPPEKKVYSDDHVCPIKEQRMAKRRGKPAHPVVKWSSRIVMALAIIPIILVLAFIGAINFMDYNQYKPQIESEFQKRTGYGLKINGPIDVSVWPFALEAKQVELQNRPSFSSPNLAQIDSIQVELSLWSLFVNRHLELLGVELEKPLLFLETNAAGQHNWRLLQQRLALTAAQPKPPGLRKVAYQVVTAPVEVSDTTELVDWHLDSFVLQNAIIEWQNEQAKTHLTMEDFDLMAFDISPNQPFKVLTNFQYDSSEIKSSFHFNVASMLTLNNRFSQWTLSDWTGNVRLVLPKTMQIPEVRIEMAGDLFELKFDQQSFHVEQARFRSLKGSLETSMSGTYGRNAETQGALKANHINLRKWFRHSGVTYPNFVDKTVLKDVSAEFNWSQTPDQLSVENLALQLDQSKITGNIWRKLQAEKPQYRFDLAISKLDLDRYEAYADSKPSNRTVQKNAKPVSNSPKAAKQDSSVSTKVAKEETYLPVGLPITTLRGLQAEGHLHIAKLKAWQMQMQEFEINLSANAGKLQLAPLDANLYQGTLRSKLLVDVTGKTPHYDWSGRMEGVQLKPFLTDGWQYELLEGQYDSTFNFNTLGVNSFLLKQNLNGSFNAKVQAGQFKGMDLNKLLAGQKTSAKDATTFSQLSMAGDIQSGVMALRRMNVKSDRFSAIGTGQLILPTAQLNAVLHTTYHRPPQRLQQLKGVEVPVHLKGALGNVQWSVDLKKLLSNPANQQKLLNSLQQFLQAS
ncbi:MAG: hypothetical protein DSZ27_07720 [Thiomicrospira sp.]|nr:MAG: hypothetical protein DSZ27_07720 [Thiomicrospira sp.]